MANILQVSAIPKQLGDTPDNPMPQSKRQAMERAKHSEDSGFSDIFEISRQCVNFNRACLMSKIENISLIRKEMQEIVQNLKTTGIVIIKDMSYTKQTQARQLLEN